jgi:hypothetical protein
MQPEEHQDDPRFAVEIDAVRFDPEDDAAMAGRRAAAGAKRGASARDRGGTTTMHKVDQARTPVRIPLVRGAQGFALVTSVELA